MDYLDIERIFHFLICIITVILGINLAFLCILYEEENIKLAQAANASYEVVYLFSQDKWLNLSMA